MRSGSHLIVAVSLAAAVAACSNEPDITITEFQPNAALSRVRVVNLTNTTLEFSSPAGEYAGVNRNIRFAGSRCFELQPNTAPLVRDSATQTELTGLPTTFEAGKPYSLVIYRPTTTATTYSFASWEADTYVPPTADSAGMRFMHLGTGQAGVDVYLNIPNSASPPALTAANRVATNLAFGAVTNFRPVKGNVSYQIRVTRTGSTTSANILRDETFTVQPGESGTYILGMPSVTAATTFRSTSVGGC
jgi:hypothetical protein